LETPALETSKTALSGEPESAMPVEKSSEMVKPSPAETLPAETIPEADVETWVEQITEKTVDRLSDTLLEKAVDRAAQKILQQMEKKLAEKVEKLATAKVASIIQERSLQMEKTLQEEQQKKKLQEEKYSFEVRAIEKPAAPKETAPETSTSETSTPASAVAVKKVPEEKIWEETFSEGTLPEGTLPELAELPELPELAEIQEVPVVEESTPAPSIGNQASVEEETPGFIKISGRKKGNRGTVEKKQTVSVPTSPEEPEEPDETAGFVRIGSKAKKSPNVVSSKQEPQKEVAQETPQEEPREVFQDVRLTPCHGVVLNTESEVREIRMGKRGICDTVEISPRQISLIGKQTGETLLQIFFQNGEMAPMLLRVTVEGGSSEETQWISWCDKVEKAVLDKTGATVSIFLFQNRVFLKGSVSAASTVDVITGVLQEAFAQFQQENPQSRLEEKMLLVNLLQVP
ncbi:MAG: pilus assembly protein N-terminal domain-containing protein, partial [Planctomycetia bacterium]|nr:pilus assembly protein N-terminal domain-containing protein [Planctomycetia bacterium]